MAKPMTASVLANFMLLIVTEVQNIYILTMERGKFLVLQGRIWAFTSPSIALNN
jgi:hypothetical protein